MCLLLVNLDGRPIPPKYIIQAASTNRDGFGMMYADKTGTLKTIQGLFNTEKILKCFEAAEKQKVRYVAHFRYSTRGHTNVENTHPFILSREYSGGIGMAHNGTFSVGEGKNDFGKSDTRILAERIQDKILQDDSYHTSIFSPIPHKLKNDFGNIIGGWNKVAFLNGLGEVNILNEDDGYWLDGVWYSNLYSIGHGYGYTATVDCKRGHYLHHKEKLAELLGKSEDELEYDLDELNELDFDAFSSAAEDIETIPDCDIEEIQEDFEEGEVDLWEKWKKENAVKLSNFDNNRKNWKRNNTRNKDVIKRFEYEGIEVELSENDIEDFASTEEIKEQIRKAFLEGVEVEEEDELDSLAALKKAFEEDESKETKTTALTTTTSSTSYFDRWKGNGYDYSHSGYYGRGSGYTPSYLKDDKDKFVEMLLKP